ncbi:MAG: ankyrin repeat domain-containing protein [Coprobacillaceae bacterium]
MSKIFIDACKNGKKGVVQAFLKKGGIDLDTRDEFGNTALFYACNKGARDIVKLLLDNGADASIENNENMSVLHSVSNSGNKEIIKILLDAGTDINLSDNSGRKPLMYTILSAKTEAAKYLVEQGADITIKDNDEHTALDYASTNGLRDLIALLSSNVNDTNVSGVTPLMQAVYDNQAEVVDVLLKNEDINIDAINDAGETSLLIALKNNNLRIAEVLLKAKTNPNLKTLDGNTVIHYAVNANNIAMCKTLEPYIEKFDDKNNWGVTPLIIACQKGYNEISRWLIEKEVNVNAIDEIGYSTLHYASENGFTDIVEQLIMAGAEE